MWNNDNEDHHDAEAVGWLIGIVIGLIVFLVLFPFRLLGWSVENPRAGLVLIGFLSVPFWYMPDGGPRAYAVHRAKYVTHTPAEHVVGSAAAYLYAAGLVIKNLVRPIVTWLARLVGFSTCTKSEERRLQTIVKTACSTPHKCTGVQDCPTLIDNQIVSTQCITARSIIMQQCFLGGDKGHRQALQQERNALQRCNSLLLSKECI